MLRLAQKQHRSQNRHSLHVAKSKQILQQNEVDNLLPVQRQVSGKQVVLRFARSNIQRAYKCTGNVNPKSVKQKRRILLLPRRYYSVDRCGVRGFTRSHHLNINVKQHFAPGLRTAAIQQGWRPPQVSFHQRRYDVFLRPHHITDYFTEIVQVRDNISGDEDCGIETRKVYGFYEKNVAILGGTPRYIPCKGGIVPRRR